MDPLVAGVGEATVTERYAVRGMTCASCVRHVEAALAAVAGVQAVRVDLARGVATVRRVPSISSPEALREAVSAAGYALEAVANQGQGEVARAEPPARPIALGLLAALGLLGFYLGVITLAQGWGHAVQQLAEDRWFVGAIMAGFGTQVGLFTHLRERHARLSGAGVAASTGTSTAAMLACCAHHLTDIVPVLGLSGAAIFLNAYKTPLLWAGIAMNLVGVAYLTRQGLNQRAMACHTPADRQGEAR